MFWTGFGTGAANKLTEKADMVQQRIDKQMEEAREMSAVYQKRQQEASQIKDKIKQSTAAYGIPENVLLNAYKNGHLDSYLKLVEKARMKPGGDTLDGAQLSSWYDVPSHVLENTRGMDDELQSIFGLIERGVDDADEIDNVSIGRMLFQAIGGDEQGMLRDNARRRTVKGVRVDDLLNLGDPVSPEPTGGSINYQPFVEQFGGDDGPASLPQEWKATADSITNVVFGQVSKIHGGQFNTASYSDFVRARIDEMVISHVVDSFRSGKRPTSADIDISEFVRQNPGEGTGSWIKSQDAWLEISATGTPTGGRRALDDPPPRTTISEDEEEDSASVTTTTAPAATPAATPPSNVRPTLTRGSETYTLTSAPPTRDGAYTYVRQSDGKTFLFKPPSQPEPETVVTP